MDSTSIESDIPDLLEFLRPPVKKSYYRSCPAKVDRYYCEHESVKETCIVTIFNQPNRVYKKSRRSNDFRKISDTSQCIKRNNLYREKSATEFFKNNNIQRRNRKKSFNRHQLIYITVIPKISKSETQNKELSNTCFENLVARPSKSANELNYFDERSIPLPYEKGNYNLLNDKHLFFDCPKSMAKMEERSKSPKHIYQAKLDAKTKEIQYNTINQDTSTQTMTYNIKTCQCTGTSCGIKTQSNETDIKSHVKISGRLGLSNDNKYVLQCSATVDDEPVRTEQLLISQETSPLQTVVRKDQQQQKNSNKLINMDKYPNKCPDKCLPCMAATECPAIDDNFDKYRSIQIDTMQGECEERKRNPVFLISIFPKKCESTSNLQIYVHKSTNEKVKNNQYNKTQDRHKQNVPELPKHKNVNQIIPAKNKDVKKRGVSPVSRYDKPRGNTTKFNVAANETNRTPKKNDLNVKQQPPVDKDIHNKNNTIKNCDTFLVPKPAKNVNNVNASNKDANKKRFPEKQSPSQQTKTKKIVEVSTKQKVENQIKKAYSLKRDQGTAVDKQSPRLMPKVSKTTNTVDYKMKTVEVKSNNKPSNLVRGKQVDEKKCQTGPSNVTINIHNYKEHYNVLVRQNSTTTDLTVKSVKKHASPIKYENKSTFDNLQSSNHSLENFLLMMTDDDFKHKTSFSQTMLYQPEESVGTEGGHVPYEQVKDSLQIQPNRINRSISNLLINEDEPNNSPSAIEKSKGITKHYRGDNCSLLDRNERDKVIRELLGVNSIKSSRTSRANFTHDVLGPFFSWDSKSTREKYKSQTKHITAKSTIFKMNPFNLGKSKTFQGKSKKIVTEKLSAGTQYHKSDIPRYTIPIYQPTRHSHKQEVLYRIVEMNSDKCILLTRKQFRKVKKSIVKSLKDSKTKTRKFSFKKTSRVSTDTQKYLRKVKITNKSTQTDPGSVQFDHVDSIKYILKFDPHGKQKRYDKKPSTEEPQVGIINNTVSTEVTPRRALSSIEVGYVDVLQNRNRGNVVDYSRQQYPPVDCGYPLQGNIKKHNTEVGYSVHTLFRNIRGKRKKSVTPNLGNSTCFEDHKDVSDKDKEVKFLMTPRPQKRAFLRRLMSCLVLKSSKAPTKNTKTSNVEVAHTQQDSSGDSYYISTSLCAIEMSSSIYDTSASFFTDHAIIPVSNRIKRGFFGSVIKGYLMKS